MDMHFFVFWVLNFSSGIAKLSSDSIWRKTKHKLIMGFKFFGVKSKLRLKMSLLILTRDRKNHPLRKLGEEEKLQQKVSTGLLLANPR